MSLTRIASRIATATLATALTLGGLAGLGAVDLSDHLEDAPTEQAGATWSITGRHGPKGGSETDGATWS